MEDRCHPKSNSEFLRDDYLETSMKVGVYYGKMSRTKVDSFRLRKELHVKYIKRDVRDKRLRRINYNIMCKTWES